jgi:hypothetical protein
LETKVASLEERLEHTLAHTANLATLLLSVQRQVGEVEDAIMDESEEDAEGDMVVSSSLSDLDPMENVVAIPIPAPTIIHTLVEIPEEFIPPSFHSTPSPLYILAWGDDLLHDGVPEYWADPEVGLS